MTQPVARANASARYSRVWQKDTVSLRRNDQVCESPATKFFKHDVHIAVAMVKRARYSYQLWKEANSRTSISPCQHLT
jgi:hypothetical protein